MLITVIVFVLMLGLLVLVHEFGHYIVAVKKGIKVEEFAFGFGPKIFSFKGKKTLFKINLIPLGGYVKLSDQYKEKTVWQRIQVITAGVLMNLFLAIFLFFVAYGIVGREVKIDEDNKQYLVTPLEETSIIITGIVEDSSAYGKLKLGDIVLNFYIIEDFQEYIQRHPEQEISLSILRNQEEVGIKIVPNLQGYIGVKLIKAGIVRYPLDQAFLNTFSLLILPIEGTFVFFRDLITGEIEYPGEYIGGPVKIFQVVDQVIPRGIGTTLTLIGLLSVFLAIINILPFPALDGGHLVFLIIEGVRKKPVSEKIQNTVHGIGFALLMLLFITIIINDIRGLL